MLSLGAAFFFASRIAALWQFYVFIGVMVGLGVSLNGMVSSSALLARWYRKHLATAIGIAFAGIGVGALLLVPLAQYLITHYEWRQTYRILGMALLVAAPLVMFLLPWRTFAAGHPELSRTKATGTQEGATVRAALRTPVFWGLATVFFCTATAMFSIIVQLVVFFIETGFSPLTSASAYGAIGLLSAASVMLSGLVSEHFGYRQTVTASFVGTGTGILLLLLISALPSFALLGAFVIAFGLCMGVRGPIVSSISARYFAGPNVATIYGAIYATNALGAAFGSFVGGVLHDLTGGYRVGLGFALGFVLLAALPFWTVRALRNFR